VFVLLWIAVHALGVDPQMDKGALNAHHDGAGDDGETTAHFVVKRGDQADEDHHDVAIPGWRTASVDRHAVSETLTCGEQLLATEGDFKASWAYLFQRYELVAAADRENDGSIKAQPYHVPTPSGGEKLVYDHTKSSWCWNLGMCRPSRPDLPTSSTKVACPLTLCALVRWRARAGTHNLSSKVTVVQLRREARRFFCDTLAWL